jgi:folate-binding protein YgfZ
MTKNKFSAIIFRGPDATSYLNSIISQAVKENSENQYGLVLSPQGFAFGFLFLKFKVDHWLIATQSQCIEDVTQNLKKFKIRVNFDIETPELTDEEIVADFPELDYSSESERIQMGLPAFGLDVKAKSIPQEYHCQHKFINFEKGCFIGQELVCRIDSRGAVRKHLLVGIQVEQDSSAESLEKFDITSQDQGNFMGYTSSAIESGIYNVDTNNGVVTLSLEKPKFMVS